MVSFEWFLFGAAVVALLIYAISLDKQVEQELQKPKPKPVAKKKPATTKKPAAKKQAPAVKKAAPKKQKRPQLTRMNKDQLEEYARSIGLELDKRKTKKNMIIDIHEFNKK